MGWLVLRPDLYREVDERRYGASFLISQSHPYQFAWRLISLVPADLIAIGVADFFLLAFAAAKALLFFACPKKSKQPACRQAGRKGKPEMLTLGFCFSPLPNAA